MAERYFSASAYYQQTFGRQYRKQYWTLAALALILTELSEPAAVSFVTAAAGILPIAAPLHSNLHKNDSESSSIFLKQASLLIFRHTPIHMGICITWKAVI